MHIGVLPVCTPLKRSSRTNEEMAASHPHSIGSRVSISCFNSAEMKTTSTTKANQFDGNTAQPGRASRFASAPTCLLPQVVWVVSNYIFVIDDHLEFLSFSLSGTLSGTLDGAGGVGGLLATEVGGTWYFPLYDNNGNITDYVSETGEVVASYEYDAFGRTIAQSGAMADTFPFRFSTKYFDAESGFYYYGYRYYSPELGRWLTRDPIEEDGGDNLYAFCGNNGIGLHDPFGESSEVIPHWPEPDEHDPGTMLGAGNFPGAGWKDVFRTRPATYFDLSAKIHDLHYSLNDVSFGFKANIWERGNPIKAHNGKANLSRKAKADYIFRKMNDAARSMGIWSGFLNFLSRRVFYDDPKYFCKGDGFQNFKDHPRYSELNDPEKYLMIPYESLHVKHVKDEFRLRVVPGHSVGRGGHYVHPRTYTEKRVVPDYDRLTDEDDSPGFFGWLTTHYDDYTWKRIGEINNETDNSFKW